MKNITIFLAIAVVACGAAVAVKPTVYGAALEECNRTSKTCAESIDCENRLRADAGRPLRAQDGCK